MVYNSFLSLKYHYMTDTSILVGIGIVMVIFLYYATKLLGEIADSLKEIREGNERIVLNTTQSKEDWKVAPNGMILKKNNIH